jgi:CheY-like chemotaxis protein
VALYLLPELRQEQDPCNQEGLLVAQELGEVRSNHRHPEPRAAETLPEATNPHGSRDHFTAAALLAQGLSPSVARALAAISERGEEAVSNTQPGACSVISTEAETRRRILVVDDEPAICASVKRILGTTYDLHIATRAQEALAQVERGDRYDLIFCDLMMPEMTGMDLHSSLQKLAPDQAERMVFLTGGAFTPKARDFLANAPNAKVDKPFNKDTLRALVAEKLQILGV